MDPVSALGVASGVIAILQLTGTVISQGYSYLATLKDAPKELEALVQELTSLSGILSFLKAQLENPQTALNNDRFSTLLLLGEPRGPLESCDSILKRVQKRLTKLTNTPKIGSYHVGFFKDKDIKQDIERLERLKSIFQLALHRDHITLSRAIDDYIRKTLEESQKEQHIIGTHVRNTDSNVEDLCRESKIRAVKEDALEDHLRKTLDNTLSGQQILRKHARDTSDNLEQLCRDTKRRISDEEEIRKKVEIKKRRDEILQWLSKIDHQSNHHAACALQQPGTGVWFTEGSDFREWQKEAGSVLWLHGIPGAGKTILTSTIIQKAFSIYGNSTDTAIAYFYFDFKDHEKQKTAGMLGSLIFQLFKSCDTIPDEINAMYEKHQTHLCPSIEELRVLLRAISGSFKRCFLILDALDECDERETLLRTLDHLIQPGGLSNTSFLLTSRKEHDIETAFSRHKIHPVFIQDDKVAIDVGLYVREKMESDEKLKILKEDLKKDIISVLAQRAKGMFRWVKCQLDTIRDLKRPKVIREALTSLPQSLDDTYDRILLSIRSEDDKELIRRALQLVIFAARPMTLEEVAEAVVIEEGIENLDEDARFNEPSSLISICGSLFSFTGGNLGLAHYSVQEYLMSERIQKGPASRFYMQELSASIEISKICLTYLGFTAFDSGPCGDQQTYETRLKLFPLLKYAAGQWFEHAKYAEAVQEAVMELFKRVGIENTPKNMSLIQVYESRYGSSYFDTERGEPTLYLLARWGLATLTSYLLSMGVDPNTTHNHNTVLHQAIDGGHKPVVKILLQNGADANAHIWRSRTPLHLACINGDEGTVQMLLQHGADVNAKDDHRGTPLYAACDGGYEGIVQMLLQHGALVNAKTRLSGSGAALYAACSKGSEDMVQILLQHGADINAKDDHRGTPLYAAYSKGYEGIVQMLLQHGTDVNSQCAGYEITLNMARSREYEGMVQMLLQYGADVNAEFNYEVGGYVGVLHIACYRGNKDIVRMLLQHGADVNSDYGAALYTACFNGDEGIIQMLLQHGANVNAGCERYGTALHAACSEGYENIVQILLQHGADVNAKGGSLGTALHAACSEGYEGVVRMLLQNRADVNAQHEEYETALYAACFKGREGVVRILLQYGADVNAKDGSLGTALHAACSKGYEGVVQMLLQHGADVNSKDSSLRTALHAACSEGYEDMVQMLLQHGADVNSKDSSLRTALHAACSGGYKGIVQMLLQYGADVNTEPSEHGTVLGIARHRGYKGIARMLSQHWATSTE